MEAFGKIIYMRGRPAAALARGTALAALAAGSMGWSGLAFAQATESDGNIADIVVTAQFKNQDMQEAPLAITAVDAKLMEARSQTNVAELATRAPSVQFTAGGQGGSSITLEKIAHRDVQLVDALVKLRHGGGRVGEIAGGAHLLQVIRRRSDRLSGAGLGPGFGCRSKQRKGDAQRKATEGQREIELCYLLHICSPTTSCRRERSGAIIAG